MQGEIRLSWLAKLANAFRIEGDEGTITGSIYDWGSVELTSRSGRRQAVALKSSVRSLRDIAPRIMENFLAMVAGEEAPLIPAREVVPSIALIEECYARRRRFTLPWQDYVG